MYFEKAQMARSASGLQKAQYSKPLSCAAKNKNKNKNKNKIENRKNRKLPTCVFFCADQWGPHVEVLSLSAIASGINLKGIRQD